MTIRFNSVSTGRSGAGTTVSVTVTVRPW